MNFTLDQKKAHDATRHISITANAGSGKTRVLVSRYCDILQHAPWELHPEDVAAITFTEKAASELRSKIAQELESRLRDPLHQPYWNRLKDIRERFTSAVVTTIHGFCSQLLREFPIEAEVPPNFAVLSGYERKQAQEDALMEAIEIMLRSPDGAESTFSPAYEVARRIGRERMEEIVRSMLYNREIISYSRGHGVLALGREETLAHWQAKIDETVRGLLFNHAVREAIRSIIDQLKDEPAAEAVEVYATARRARSAGEIISTMNELRRLLLTTSNNPRQKSYRLPKEELGILDPYIATVVSAFDSAKPFLETGDDPSLHQTLFDDGRVLLDIYNEAERRYNDRKRRINALDFEDLQLRLLEALEQPDAALRIAGRFRYLMVDEFQDTNEIQYAIALRLLKGLNAGNLCIVGDRKQSIYGFRNAEVEVFNHASEDIKRHNGEHRRGEGPLVFRNELLPADTAEEGLGVIKLDASFRLLPSICAYVNAACEPIMNATGGTGFGIDYEPLVCARRSDGEGRVEFILSAPEPEPADDDAPASQILDALLATDQNLRTGNEVPFPTTDHGPLTTDQSCDISWCPESDMIARRLLGLVRGGEQVVWECDADGVEQPRPPRFSDMAILCRKRSHFPPLEVALRKYGVPFVTFGGVGFYKTQEIYDLANYLRALLNSRDDIALLGVLRSPYFCVSDAEIYRISQADESGKLDLWSRALRRAESGQGEPALVRAVSIISDDRSMASRIPVSLLMRRAIERTGWRGAVIGSERGEQARANIEKLLEMAREFEERGFTNLFDFVERITELIEAEEVESEAPINTGRDAVRLMTMHGAKGLEFPVVVLPSLQSKAGGSSRFYFDKELGFGWNWSFNKTEFRPAVVGLMNVRGQWKDRAEEARLFYVAATRARDLLILSGEYNNQKPPRDTMLNWGLAPLQDLPAEEEPDDLAGNRSVPLFSPALRFLNPDGATERVEPWEQMIDIHRTIADLPKYAPYTAEPIPFRADLVRIGELPTRAEGEIYSASQFLVYSQCPTKYYLKYRLGIPEEFSSVYKVDPNGRDAGEDGTIFARLFRQAAARIDLTPGLSASPSPLTEKGGDDADTGNTDLGSADTALGTLQKLSSVRETRTIGEIIEEVLLLEPLSEEQLEIVRPRLLETFERILASPAARDALLPSGTTPSVEQELRLPFDHDFVMGVMDRMLVDSEGTISLLHYKTLRLDRENLARVAEGYLPQLRLYAYLVSSLNPAQRSIRATLLFTEHPDAPQSFTFTKFDMLRIEEELRAAIADIRQITYTGRRELPLRTAHCPLCPYYVKERCMLEVR